MRCNVTKQKCEDPNSSHSCNSDLIYRNSVNILLPSYSRISALVFQLIFTDLPQS